jgi:hypothetical protein
MHEAEVTVCALGVVLFHAEEREAGKNAEEGAERAEDPARTAG